MESARAITSGLPERAEKYLVPVLVLVFAVMSLAAVRRAEYIAFQDYPSYLLRLHILKHYDDPAYGYPARFALNLGLAPNQAADLLLYAFALFAPPAVASKLLISLYIVLLPLSAFYFLRSTNPANVSYALLAVALYANFFLVMFFMNFVLGIAPFLFFLGHWTRNRENFGWRTRVVNAVLLVVLYYCHMLIFACALLVAAVFMIAEKKKAGFIVRRALDFLPGILLFVAWLFAMLAGGTLGDAQFRKVSMYLSTGDKLADLISSLSPCLLPDADRAYYQALFSIFALSMLALGMFGDTGGAESRDHRIWKRTVGVLVLAAVILPRWLVIYLPGPRVLLLAILLAPALFPRRRAVRYGFLCFLVVLTFYLRTWEARFLDEKSKEIAYIVSPFQDLPPDIQSRAERVLPLVLPPYVYRQPYHRVFEYYFIRNGGIGPYHLLGPDYTVRYRVKLPAPPQYEPFPEKIPREMLEGYDMVIVLGKDGDRGGELIRYLAGSGFREIRGNAFTGIFVRP